MVGKTTESDRHPNPTTNPNPNPYLVAVRYGSLAEWFIV